MVKDNQTRSRRKPSPLVGKSLVRKSLRRDGRKHGITVPAFETLSFVGKSFLERVIMKAKTEQNYSTKSNATPKSISVGSISESHFHFLNYFLNLKSNL